MFAKKTEEYYNYMFNRKMQKKNIDFTNFASTMLWLQKGKLPYPLGTQMRKTTRNYT